jgi:hypothetical protein
MWGTSKEFGSNFSTLVFREVRRHVGAATSTPPVPVIAQPGHAFDPIGGSCYGAPTLRRLRYLRIGAWALGVATVAAGLLAGPGCGPVEFLNQVSGKAARAVAAAKEADAEKHAPYEYTAAVEYLHKAREEGGHAEYQIAIAYGRRAEELATRARALAEEKRADGGAGPEPGTAAKDTP